MSRLDDLENRHSYNHVYNSIQHEAETGKHTNQITGNAQTKRQRIDHTEVALLFVAI